jgi:uncharacterized delta-60 repeat protein
MDTRRLAGITAALAIGIGSAAWVRAAPGDLDATFGEGGIVRFDADGDSDYATSIFTQSDGKLLVGRTNDLETDDFSVLRFNADGTPDASFGADGRTSLDIAGGHGWTTAVVQQSDGSIVAAGAGTQDLVLVRYLPDGRPDTGFGVDGVVHYPMRASAVLQQADGKLVVAGHVNPACMGCWDDGGTETFVPGVARFDSAGVIDTGFGADGTVVFDSEADLTGIVQQPDGTLLVVGSGAPRSSVGPVAMTVHRVTRDGQLDPTFGDAGVVRIEFAQGDGAEGDAYGKAIALASDGKIVVAGTADFECCNWTDVTGDLAIARLNPDGSLDGTFGESGRVLYDHGASETIDEGGLVVEPGGTIVVAGHRSIVDTNEVLPAYGLLARFTADGALDRSFGQDGVALIDVGHGDSLSSATAHGIVQLQDGSLAVAFTAEASTPDAAIAIARVAPTGGPGIIGLTRNAVTVTEGITESIVVKRMGGAAGVVSAQYGTYEGSLSGRPDAALASAGADFTPTAGTLTWQDGDTTDRVIAIPTAADGLDEPDETFLVRLSAPTGGAHLATTGAEITIAGSQAPGTPLGAGFPSSTPAGHAGGGGASGILDTLLLGVLVGWTRLRKSRTRA